MNKRNSWQAHRVAVPIAAMAAALLVGVLLAGCGGGADEPVTLRAPPAAVVAPVSPAAPLTVRLEGCVVDDYFVPRGQTPVRALAADGRLLGNAQSDPRGAFALQLPAGQNVSLAVDRADGDVIKVATGHRSRALTTCLLDPSA